MGPVALTLWSNLGTVLTLSRCASSFRSMTSLAIIEAATVVRAFCSPVNKVDLAPAENGREHTQGVLDRCCSISTL